MVLDQLFSRLVERLGGTKFVLFSHSIASAVQHIQDHLAKKGNREVFRMSRTFPIPDESRRRWQIHPPFEYIFTHVDVSVNSPGKEPSSPYALAVSRLNQSIRQ